MTESFFVWKPEYFEQFHRGELVKFPISLKTDYLIVPKVEMDVRIKSRLSELLNVPMKDILIYYYITKIEREKLVAGDMRVAPVEDWKAVLAALPSLRGYLEITHKP